MSYYRPAAGAHREMRGSKRRTVLQLGSPSKSSYLSRYGYGRNEEAETTEENVQKEQSQQQGLSLLGQYADSDSEEDGSEKEEAGNIDDEAVEKTEPTEAASQNPDVDAHPLDNGTAEIPDMPVPEKSKMDTEVASFLAEIEAISTDQTSQDSFPSVPVDRNSPEPHPHFSADISEVAEETQEKQSTNHYKQFVKGASEFVKKPDNDNKKLQKNLDEEIIIEEPFSLWERCLDENTQYHYFWNTISNAVTWELPSEYTQYLLQKKEFEEKIEIFKKEGQKYKINSNKDNDKKISDDPLKKVADEDRQETKECDKSVDEKDKDEETVLSPHIPSAAADPVKSEKMEDEEVKKQETETEKRKSEDRNVCPPEMTETTEPRREKHKKKKKKHKRDDREEGNSKSRSSKRGQSSSRKSRKESKDSNDKEPKEEIDIDIDLDDIDKALEMALENKTSKKSKKDGSSAETSSRTSHKRSKHRHSRDTDASLEEPVTKRTKLVDYSIDQEEDKSDGEITGKLERTEEKKIEKVHKSEEESKSTDSKPKKSSHKRKNDKLHILDMAELCLSKLEFLEITKKGLSKLQILLIEIETRYNDWQSGVLETEYFLMKLKLANNQLALYEESAAPPGWTCSWDRPYRRYFYTNEATGESQWDYPDVAEADEQDQPPSPMEEGEIPDEVSDHEEKNTEQDLHSIAEESLSRETAADITASEVPDETFSQVVKCTESEKNDNPDAKEQPDKEVSDTEMTSSTTTDTCMNKPEIKEELDGTADKQTDSLESTLEKDNRSTPDSKSEDESQTVVSDEGDEKITEPSARSSNNASYKNSEAIQDVIPEQSVLSSDSTTEHAPPLPPIIYPGQPPPPGTEFLVGLLAPPPPPPPPDPDFDVPVFYGPLPQGVSGHSISSNYVSSAEAYQDPNYQYDDQGDMLEHIYNNDYSVQDPTVSTEFYADQEQVSSEMCSNQESGFHVKSELESYDYVPTDDSTADSNYQHDIKIKNEPYFDECSESDIPLSKSPQIFAQDAGDSNSLDKLLPIKDEPDSPDPECPPSPEGIIIGNPFPSNNLTGQDRVSHSPSDKSSAGQDSQKEKRKRKDKLSTGLALKRKGVSSLVQKWQKVKKEVEKEEQDEERRQQEIRKQLDEWKKDYI